MSKRRNSLNRHPVMNIGIAIALIITLLPLGLLVLQCFLTRWTGLIPTEWTMRGINTFISKADEIASVTLSTLLLGFSSAIIATLVGMAASRALINHQIKHKVAWDLLIMLALIVPPTVCGVGMRTLFLKLGFANTWGSVLFSLVIANIPYCTKIMMDITSTVGISFEQEARVLGLGKVRAYFVGTVPLIVPGILTSLGFGFMTAVNQYFYVAFMGAGRIKSLIVSIVLPAVSHSAMPVAATYCVFFILFNVVIFAFFQFLAKKAQKAVGKNVGA